LSRYVHRAANFDAIIIGTGQAAPALAGRLTQAGVRIAVIERTLAQMYRRFGSQVTVIEKGPRLAAEKTRTSRMPILGAAILGTGGDEVIHCILDIMYADVPYTVLRRAMHIHPTVSELIPTMLGELQPWFRDLTSPACRA
jgi:pyruvate/2-oxoglutarate dehydrogenase complex dihydrolipoamide dehydrogenase (E3) component